MSDAAAEDVKDITLELIEMYKQCPCLWDTKCDIYPHRESRSRALNSLLVIYRKMQPNATIDHLKKKLENIKSCYKREFRKVKASGLKGRRYIPRLWYYEYMTFLDDRDDPRDGNLDEESLNAEFTPYDGADHTRDAPSTSSRASTPSAPRKKRQPNIVAKKALIDSVKTLMSSREEEWEVIGRSLGLQLKQLSSHQQTIALKLISDVIFLGKREKLMDHASINLSPPASNLAQPPSALLSTAIVPPHHHPLTSSVSQLSPLTPDIPTSIKLREAGATETPLSSEY